MRDFAQLGQFVHVDNHAFRAIKAATPGPYTFILPATGEVPRRLMHPKKRTVGVRIPDHVVVHALLAAARRAAADQHADPARRGGAPDVGWEIKEELDHDVDLVVEAGETPAVPTTVVDWSEDVAGGHARAAPVTPTASSG